MATTIGLFELTAVATGSVRSDDVLAIVDVHDTAQSAQGSVRKTTLAALYRTETVAVTVSTPLPDIAQTWNAGGVTFTAVRLNVTDTASAVASLLLDLQVGGVSKWKVQKDGTVTQAGPLNATGNSTITGALTVTGTITGQANSLFSNNLTIGGVLSVGGGIAVIGASTITGTLSGITALTIAANGVIALSGNGTIAFAAGTTAATVGAAGGAAALPATPLGYWIVAVGGANVKVPYYNT